MEPLTNRIDAFCEKHELSEWQFGELALKDRHFVRQVRAGRDLRMSTVRRVEEFMAEYRPDEASPPSEAAA